MLSRADIHVPTMDASVLDEVVTVGSQEALAFCHRLAREEGLFVGPSSGAAILGAVQVPFCLPVNVHISLACSSH